MIDLDVWSREIRRLCGELPKTLSDGVEVVTNGLAPAADLDDLATLKRRFSGHDLAQMLSFYTRYDGALFADLRNGYFIQPIWQLLQVRDDIPVRVEGSLTREVLPFGSDGGGNLIALSLGQQTDILFLPHGSIRDSIYRDSPPRLMRILAEDFDGFLKRLLEDLRAFVSRTPGWQFMDGGIQ
jgi:hypothetical protein